jgi:hypothetical protein
MKEFKAYIIRILCSPCLTANTMSRTNSPSMLPIEMWAKILFLLPEFPEKQNRLYQVNRIFKEIILRQRYNVLDLPRDSPQSSNRNLERTVLHVRYVNNLKFLKNRFYPWHLAKQSTASRILRAQTAHLVSSCYPP